MPNPPPFVQPPTSPSAKKPNKWPWLVGGGCLTLLVIVVAVAAFVLYRYQTLKHSVEVTRAELSVAPAQKNATPSNARAPQPNVSSQPAGWKTYDSTKEKIGPELQPHFVAFSFSYPPGFVATPQEDLFVVLEKRAANGKDVAESFSVSWYETSDAGTNKEDYRILKDLGKQWPQQYPQYNCKEFSTFSLKVGGVIGVGTTWEFTTRDRNAAFVSAARSILVHPLGQGRGVRIDQYGTWLDSKVKSASDVGKNDDLAAILNTFKFLETSAQSPTTTRSPDITKSDSPLTAQDQQDIVTAATRWLRLLDGGDYRASFDGTAEQFRQGVTREQWGTTLSSMKKQYGPLVSRSDDVKLVTKTSDSDEGQHKVSYVLKIQTTFAKTAGTEELTFVKEAGQWKVADYSVETRSSR